VSHTSRCQVEFKDTDALAGAVLTMGGQVLGLGEYELFQTWERGFGFHLEGWQYPCILRSDNAIAFDDYNGHWGNAQDLETLKSQYAIAVARKAVEAQGWYCETSADGVLTVFHPDGGTITVKVVNGTADVDLCAFTGTSCVEAGNVIESALGKAVQTVNKPEMFQEQVQIAQSK
jgi:hypothetical protein